MSISSPPPPQMMAQQSASTQAITSLILGILGVICCGLMAPIAWYIGSQELKAIQAGLSPAAGDGLARAGMILGIVGTILLAAHRGIESITLDRGAAHLKDELMPKYAELIYYGFWFAPEREMLQAAIDRSQEFVSGRVRLKLYKGSVGVVGRESRYSLYDQDLVTFEEGKVAYDQRDAEGFIRLNVTVIPGRAWARAWNP